MSFPSFEKIHVLEADHPKCEFFTWPQKDGSYGTLKLRYQNGTKLWEVGCAPKAPDEARLVDAFKDDLFHYATAKPDQFCGCGRHVVINYLQYVMDQPEPIVAFQQKDGSWFVREHTDTPISNLRCAREAPPKAKLFPKWAGVVHFGPLTNGACASCGMSEAEFEKAR